MGLLFLKGCQLSWSSLPPPRSSPSSSLPAGIQGTRLAIFQLGTHAKREETGLPPFAPGALSSVGQARPLHHEHPQFHVKVTLWSCLALLSEPPGGHPYSLRHDSLTCPKLGACPCGFLKPGTTLIWLEGFTSWPKSFPPQSNISHGAAVPLGTLDAH